MKNDFKILRKSIGGRSLMLFYSVFTKNERHIGIIERRKKLKKDKSEEMSFFGIRHRIL